MTLLFNRLIQRYRFLILFILLPTNTLSAWYSPTWHYRVPIIIPATATVNSTVKVDVDFAALLSSMSVTGTFDINSPRIVRPNDTLANIQQYTDSIFANTTDTLNDNRGEIRFIVQDAGSATYYLYFDITTNGLKTPNPQPPINGNFESGATGASPQTPIGWQNATISDSTMQAQMRPDEAITVTEVWSIEPNTTVITKGTPNSGQYVYLQGFRSANDVGGVATLTKSITIPANNPGAMRIRIQPQGWDSGQNGNLTQYDFLSVRLLNASNVPVLNIVGPELNNYAICPFSPNNSIHQYINGDLEIITANQPGYGAYNHWDNGLDSDTHTLGMSADYKRGLELWTICTANLTSVAGQTLTLEIRTQTAAGIRTWFLIDDLEWSVVTGALGTPIAYATPMPPDNFNCVEVGDNSAIGRLYTKLVGTPFTFDVVALTTSGTVNTSFVTPLFIDPELPPPNPMPIASKEVSVELVDGSGTTDCISRTALSPSINQILTFTEGDIGRKTASAILTNQAFSNVRCRVTDRNESPAVVGCSTDNFAIRPTSLIVSTNATADSTGNNVSATPVIKAGSAFTLSASSNTSGFNATPLIDNSKIISHTGAVQAGVVSGSFNAADSATGTATANDFSYSEVGYFKFAPWTVYDDGFTGVDASTADCTPDFSNSLVNGRYGCKLGNPEATPYFGRFSPDHFALLPGLATPSCHVFSYFGQDGFSTAFTLQAHNQANAITQNYTGNFARLNLNAYSNFGFTAPNLPAGSLLSSSAILPQGIWHNGSAAIIAKHQISRPAVLTDETLVTINAAPVDLDTITMPATAATPATKLRYGRVALQNAHGSELLDLPMTLHAEYWHNNTWLTNPEESCATGITLSLADPVANDGLIPSELCVWEGGSGNSGLGCPVSGASLKTLHQPPVAGDFNLHFQATGVGNTGALDVTATVPPYLQFNWKGLGNVDPSARATFGVYKGNTGQIYFRENY